MTKDGLGKASEKAVITGAIANIITGIARIAPLPGSIPTLHTNLMNAGNGTNVSGASLVKGLSVLNTQPSMVLWLQPSEAG